MALSAATELGGAAGGVDGLRIGLLFLDFRCLSPGRVTSVAVGSFLAGVNGGGKKGGTGCRTPEGRPSALLLGRRREIENVCSSSSASRFFLWRDRSLMVSAVVPP